MGKKVVIANAEILTSENTEVEDQFYKELGSWRYKENSVFYKRKKNIPFKLVVDSVEQISASSNNSILDSGFRVTLNVQPENQKSTQDILDSAIVFNERYYDFSAEMVLPDSRPDVKRENRQNVTAAKPAVGVELLYLRENREYEDLIGPETDEKYLVNYYEPGLRNVKNKNSYVKMAKNVLNEDEGQRLAFNNIFIPPESLRKVVDTNSLLDTTSQYSYEIEDLDYTSEIPFVAKIKIKDTNGNIDQKQDFIKLGNNFMFYGQNSDPDPKGDISSLLMRWHLQNSEVFISPKTYAVSGRNLRAREQQLNSYPFLNWLNDLAPTRLRELPDNIQALKFYNTDAPSLDLAVNNYSDAISFAKTLTRFSKKFVDEYLNSNSTKRVEDVFAGLPGNTEILYYKIDKFEGNTTTGTPLQTFVIPNTKEDIEYLDTQVFYGKEYTYVISYVFAIHGCEYEYESLSEQKNDGSYDLVVRSYPSIRIVEVPAFVNRGNILAAPPLQPRVDFYPIRRQDNKIKMVFYSRYGNESTVPVSLTQGDRARNETILDNSYLTNVNSEVERSSVSTVTSFEIYTSVNKPAEQGDYSSFFANRIASVDTIADSNPKLIADSAAIVLDLMANKKYYLCFVARNRLDLASNPTKIFEVMYINQDGVSRIHYEEYNFEGEKQTLKDTKTMTKLVNIRPAYPQVAVNFEKSKLIDTDGDPLPAKNKKVFLGLREDSMFGFPGEGKKFKFRFRSRKTNKIFDINLSCVNTEVYNDFSQQSDSISLSEEEEPIEEPSQQTVPMNNGSTNLIVDVSSFKNYNILEDQNLTSRIKKVVPIGKEVEKKRKNIIGQQSRRLNDIFPTNN